MSLQLLKKVIAASDKLICMDSGHTTLKLCFRLFCFVGDRILLRSPVWPAVLDPPPQPPKCCVYRHMLLYPATLKPLILSFMTHTKKLNSDFMKIPRMETISSWKSAGHISQLWMVWPHTGNYRMCHL
jgi:hypothetical protein